MPAQLIDNWVRDCDYIDPGVPIALYYGHPKAKYGCNVKVIPDLLTIRNPIFSGMNELNACVIVITKCRDVS